MYPGSIFVWHNQSGIRNTEPVAVDNSPLYFVLSSFDKGPEGLREVKGKKFYDLYGKKMRFSAHGQPALQAANDIDNGARLLVHRLVANDAYLANLIGIASVVSNIHAISAEADDINGKTLDEIFTGAPGEDKEYVDVLSVISEVGSEVGFTKLTVSPALGTGHKYFWKETDTDVLPEKGTMLTETTGYTEWDGTSDLKITDGTKIELVEYSGTLGIVAQGIIEVVSKLDHPATTSTAPDNGLNALYMTSKESENTVGNTTIILSPAAGIGNVLFYKEVADAENPGYPDYDTPIAFVDFTGWTSWDGVSELALTDGTEIIVAEFSKTLDENDNSIIKEYNPIKAASIKVVSKLPEDTRTSESVAPVIPTEDKYIIVNQENNVKWSVVTVENCKTIKDVMEEATKLMVQVTPAIENTEEGVDITLRSDYPLIVVGDNGRCDSNKAIKFSPDLATSKDLENMMFNMTVYEGTTVVDSAVCSLNPATVVNNRRYGLNIDTCEQLVFDTVPGVFDLYIQHLMAVTGYNMESLLKSDIMFMTNNKGTSLTGVKLDPESIDFGADYGIKLESGSNGEFGDAPFGTEAWTEAALAVIDENDVLWDPDTWPIHGIFDANYPEVVKDKLAWFANEREDTKFYRDYGLDVFSYASILNHFNSIDEEYKTWFNDEFFTTYEIYDPETRVRERVTMMYDFSAAMVNHFATGAYRPNAGIANAMILPSAIEGTINFTPYKKPQVNQKALIDDLRVNYAIFQQGRCVVQSTYTADSEYSQLSFSNNVLAVEEVIRAVRLACPKHRFTFATNNDFSSYAEAVNAVLKEFRPWFAELRFDYTKDPLKASQKIFNAGIYVRFNNWAQTEYFDIYCLGDEN